MQQSKIAGTRRWILLLLWQLQRHDANSTDWRNLQSIVHAIASQRHIIMIVIHMCGTESIEFLREHTDETYHSIWRMDDGRLVGCVAIARIDITKKKMKWQNMIWPTSSSSRHRHVNFWTDRTCCIEDTWAFMSMIYYFVVINYR